MERRDFLKGMTAAGVLSVLDPSYLAARDQLRAGESGGTPVPRRPFGTTGEKLSIVGFGGIIVKDVTPVQAAAYVAEAVERGVNYFDVAPTYGNAEDRLGPALEPHRSKCFLACKTHERDAAGATRNLEASLKKLRTDHFDLYQLHALTTVEDVKKVFGPGGAMEVIVKAKKEGKIRFVGFSAHSEAAAHAALDRYSFDSILFPLGFPTWLGGDFGPSVHRRMHAASRGILALKAMAHQKWPETLAEKDRPWTKTWYQPFDAVDKIGLGLRFTLHLPVTAMVPPGHWKLFRTALGLAQAGALTPLNEKERELVAAIAAKATPIFKKEASG